MRVTISANAPLDCRPINTASLTGCCPVSGSYGSAQIHSSVVQCILHARRIGAMPAPRVAHEAYTSSARVVHEYRHIVARHCTVIAHSPPQWPPGSWGEGGRGGPRPRALPTSRHSYDNPPSICIARLHSAAHPSSLSLYSHNLLHTFSAANAITTTVRHW